MIHYAIIIEFGTVTSEAVLDSTAKFLHENSASSHLSAESKESTALVFIQQLIHKNVHNLEVGRGS